MGENRTKAKGEDAIPQSGANKKRKRAARGDTLEAAEGAQHETARRDKKGTEEQQQQQPPSFSRIYDCDSLAVTMMEFPLLLKARKVVCKLREGEMLYLPASWFHEVTSYGGSADEETGEGKEDGKGERIRRRRRGRREERGSEEEQRRASGSTWRSTIGCIPQGRTPVMMRLTKTTFGRSDGTKWSDPHITTTTTPKRALTRDAIEPWQHMCGMMGGIGEQTDIILLQNGMAKG